jgi:putative Ca2+/H+ antiporter (TMEM165/GDT1 family)
VGDKTFILVTIYTAKMKWWVIAAVASIAMCLMHTMSVGMGTIFILFIPHLYTEIIAVVLFWLMGIHAIYTSVKEYMKRRARRLQGRKETDSSDSDERAEIDEMIAQHEAELQQDQFSSVQASDRVKNNEIEMVATNETAQTEELKEDTQP